VQCQKNLLGVVVENPKPLFRGEVNPNWFEDNIWDQEYPLVSMISRDTTPYRNDIMAFIYFLAQVGGHNEIAS
jgi:hypothetical protein